MSGKILKVVAAPEPGAPKSIQASLQAAKTNGQLAVPGEVLNLTVSGGKVEVTHEK